jgi:hypothetical protein
MNLLALDRIAHHSQQYVTPKLGLSSIGQGNPRLGKVNERHTIYEEGFSPRSHLCPLLIDSHSPHVCPTPGVYIFIVTKTVLRLLNLPCLGLQQQTGLKFYEIYGSYKTPSRSSHFLCALSHLERVSHRPDNLLLQLQPPLSPRESLTHRLDSLLLQLRSSITRLNKEQMTVSNHTQPRNCVATTSHSYNTHGIDNFSGFTEDMVQLQRCVAMQRSSVETKRFSGRIPLKSDRVWESHRMTQVRA